MSSSGTLLLEFVKHEVFQRRIDVEAALDLCVSKSEKKPVTTSSDGHESRRRRDGASTQRDAAFYAHVRHEARFYGPGSGVVSTEKLHLLLVGAHGRRDLLAEGGHGSLCGRRCCLSKECCSLPEPSAARRGDGERLGGL